MPVIAEAWNNMPVQMRDQIAQTGEVDFVRLQQLAQRLLNDENDLHEVVLLCGRKIAHFAYMCVPDDAAQSGIIRFIGQDNAQLVILPEQGFCWFGMAQGAVNRHSDVFP